MIISIVYSKTSDFVHFFLIGYALSKLNLLVKFSKFSVSIACIIVGIGLIVWLGEPPMNFWEYHYYEFVKDGTIYLYFFRITASVLICLFFMIVIKIVSGIYNMFSYWGTQTLAFYLVHGMIVSALYKLPISFMINGAAYLLYAIPMTIILTLASAWIIIFLKKYELTRVYCLGEFLKRK